MNITPDTGGIRGGVFVMFGDDNPVVFDGNSGVRKIWAGASRTLKFSLQVRVCVLAVEISHFLKVFLIF